MANVGPDGKQTQQTNGDPEERQKYQIMMRNPDGTIRPPTEEELTYFETTFRELAAWPHQQQQQDEAKVELCAAPDLDKLREETQRGQEGKVPDYPLGAQDYTEAKQTPHGRRGKKSSKSDDDISGDEQAGSVDVEMN